MMSEMTVECKGALAVGLKKTGHERVSVCLAAKVNGSIMKPMIVFGGGLKRK